MAQLLSHYGKTVLALHEAISQGVLLGVAPNLYTLVLPDNESLSEMQRSHPDLLSEIDRVITAHEWRLESRPVILFECHQNLTSAPGSEQPVDPFVVARHVDHFGQLEINDDSGSRIVYLKNRRAVLGRKHDSPPRDFVPLFDASRSLSREHLLFECNQGSWRVTLIGQNDTKVGDRNLVRGVALPLEPKDRIICLPHSIIFRSSIPSQDIRP